MFQFTGVTWPWLLLFGALGTFIGILLCRLFPGEWRRPPKYRFNILTGLFSSGILTSMAAAYFGNPLVIFPTGLVIGYLASMVPIIKLTDEPLPVVEDPSERPDALTA